MSFFRTVRFLWNYILQDLVNSQELVFIFNQLRENDQETGNQSELLLQCLTNPVILPILAKCWSHEQKQSLKNGSLVLLGVASLIWFLFRTGTKPTRVTYPCQQAALNNVSAATQSILPVAITSFFLKFRLPSFRIAMSKTQGFLKRYWKPILALAIIIPSLGFGVFFVWNALNPPVYPSDVNLSLTANTATESPESDLFVVNGRQVAHIPNLLQLMGSQGLYFYQSSTPGATQGPSGLIATSDVVLIKINSQWNSRGGTNTDLLRELIEAIVLHPDGFTGEIVVADNSQGWGTLNWAESNAEDITQSVQDVVDMFSSQHQVSTFDWSPIRAISVNEYSDGDMTNGYCHNTTANLDTGVQVSYPKFQTTFGTYISFKHGIWNGASYEDHLKIINLPILKTHSNYGVTAATKHYMGVQSEGLNGGLANGHSCIGEGGMGTILAETRYPVLNILDAIHINPNPYPSIWCGPATNYDGATRVNIIMASTDPVALDYWAAKYVLMPTAEVNGHEDLRAIDPDNMERRTGLTDAFGVYLNNTKLELIRNGYTVTTNLNRMNVFITQTHSARNHDTLSPSSFLILPETRFGN
ncbi:MAG: DUF362 domain-containing protein [Candidatus Hermodarchaeota archaeon]